MNTTRNSTRVGDVYAKVLFELADRSRITETVKTNLDLLAEIFAKEKDFHALMGSPYFSLDHKKQLLQKVFSGKLSELMMDFLMIALRHNRIMFLPQIAFSFSQLWDVYYGYLNVKVVVSERFDKSRLQKLSEEIAAALKGKINLEMAVDPAIIGGIIIRYGDRIVDNTIKTRLLRAVKVITGPEKRLIKTYEV